MNQFRENGRKDFEYGLSDCGTDNARKVAYVTQILTACKKVFSETASGPQFDYAMGIVDAAKSAGFDTSAYLKSAVPVGSLEIVELPCYGGREGRMKFKHPANVAEMVNHCNQHSHIWFHSIQGDARRAKVNGVVRTWKRNPNRVEVPIKYGMHGYGTFTERDINRILIPVTA